MSNRALLRRLTSRPHLGILVVMAVMIGSPVKGQADILRPKRGDPVIGKLWEQGAEELIYNRFRTNIRTATYGVERFPKKNLKEVVLDPDPHRSFWTEADQLTPGTAEEWIALGKRVQGQRLTGLATHAFLEALVLDRENKELEKLLGSPVYKALLSDEPRLNQALKDKLDAYMTLEDPVARQAAAKEIAALSKAWPDHRLERLHRSHRQPKGLQVDQLLTLASEENPEAVYTLFVPSTYNPLVETPLVVGLHGGGPAGKDRTGVVGSGPSAMNFFQGHAQRLGWIVVCPTAQRAGWSHQANQGFLLAVVDEVCALYNIDMHRIYLAGHSMGGYGTWHFGPKHAEKWAAISPNSGGGSPSLKALRESLTGVYCHHGADDPVVTVEEDRPIAEQMYKDNMDFVYCELPNSGHGWPDEVREEMFAFLKVRRLGVPGRGGFVTSETKKSSFLAKPARAELDAFGPLFPPHLGEPSAAEGKGLLRQLQFGGGRAMRAAARLGLIQDAKLAGDAAKPLLSDKLNPEGRRFAAVALGDMGQANALKPLRRALADPSLRVAAAAALSLARLKDPDAAKSFDAGIQHLSQSFQDKLVGNAMDFTDFAKHLEAASQYAQAVELRGAPLLTNSLSLLLQHFLNETTQVSESERAGQNASSVRRSLARSILSACRLDAKASRPILETLAAKDSLGVSSDARSLLSPP